MAHERWWSGYRTASVILALASAAAGGCSDGKGPVVIGAVYDLTGAQASLDGPSARGGARFRKRERKERICG